MLITDVRNPDALLTRVRHHAKALEPIVLELLAETALKLGAVECEWTLYQARVGANSFALIGPNDSFYFRAESPYTEIEVWDAPVRPKIIQTISSPEEARIFIAWLAEALSPVIPQTSLAV